MPIEYGTKAHAKYSEDRLQERAEERRQTRMRRRRYLLWTPLAIAGAALLGWQVTQWEPVPVLIFVGILMCVPLAVDC